MKKATWISGVLLQSQFPIVLCDSESQFKSLLKKTEMPIEDWPQWVGDDEDGRTHLLGGGNTLCIVCIRRMKNKFSAMGMINHEAVHVWQFIKEHIEEGKPGDEIEAYAIQNISQRLIEAYFKK